MDLAREILLEPEVTVVPLDITIDPRSLVVHDSINGFLLVGYAPDVTGDVTCILNRGESFSSPSNL